jgi:AbrB family looped-hinge helix DNA binding protein
MAIAKSKITAQGQISIPVEIRKKLGVGPGSTLEWDESNEQVVVRRSGRHTSTDVHQALFAGKVAKPNGSLDVKEAIRTYVRKKYARR